MTESLAGQAGQALDPSLVPPGDVLIVFTDLAVDFSGVVRPGERVWIRGRKQFFRRGKLRAEVEMRRDDDAIVCSGVLSGMAVPA